MLSSEYGESHSGDAATHRSSPWLGVVSVGQMGEPAAVAGPGELGVDHRGLRHGVCAIGAALDGNGFRDCRV